MLLLFLPLAALADGMVVPTIAYPAKITIPDQRALICYTNGTERLVIETRFTGAGTNFAWVVPLPSQPVIEGATAGLFPTLQYLFRPEVVHEVPRYWLRILLTFGLIYLFRLLAKYKSPGCAAIAFIVLMCLAALLLPALSSAKRGGMESITSGQNVSILDRRLAGVFETTTIASPDAKALQAWLAENGFAVPTNAETVIASYVKDGWVFVATKVRRDKPDDETSTPHPISFTFKTDRPVYPMRLTGLDNGPLSVELYVFGSSRATASHFKVESCRQLNHPPLPSSQKQRMDYWEGWRLLHSSTETLNIAHPLLHQWTDDSVVATKLAATLSPADMRKDVWIDWEPFLGMKNRLFSRQGALTTALNWGTEFFAVGLVLVCLLAFASEKHKITLPRQMGIVVITGIAIAGFIYLCLPKIEVKLARGGFYRQMQTKQIILHFEFIDGDWHTVSEARAGLKELVSNPTNTAPSGLKDWDNDLVGGQVREEDSPGNYMLRATNSQLQLITFDRDGAEEIQATSDLRTEH